MIEREIKLRFPSADAARRSINALGVMPLRNRRLQDDRLFDWPDGRLQRAGCTLRARKDSESSVLTFKGPPRSPVMKVREEIETLVKDGVLLIQILERLGLLVCFRYQKYREEFECQGVIVAIDETPIGTFVELEGNEASIIKIAESLGQGPQDYVVSSYRCLFVEAKNAGKVNTRDMIFETRQ